MQRDNVLDTAKAFAILSVLVYHVVRTFVHCDFVGSFIDTYFLTLFFFVSGLLIKENKLSEGWIQKQMTHLLIPFVSCWLLYRIFVLTLNGTPIICKGSIDDAKGGYWFIFVLFLFNIMIFGLNKLMNCIPSKAIKTLILTVPFLGAATMCMLIPYDVAGYFSLMSIRRYWLFFAYGYALTNIFAKKELLKDYRYGALSCCMYMPLGLYYTTTIVSINTNFDFALWFITNLCAIHSWLFIFYKLQQYLSHRIVLNIGANTLGIYVFHYYPLHLLTQVLGGG